MRLDHTSRLAARWLAADEPDPWRELEGTAVLADLSGFTRLTESLAGLGAEGVEVLHRALTLCFSSLLEPSLALGGDIIGFAGDAALVWFDGDGHETRAVEAAVAMPAGLARLPAAVTGGKRIRVSVGAHTGRVVAVLAGAGQRALFLCGPAMTALVALESAAEPGQVVASEALAERLPKAWHGAPSGPGVVVRRRDGRRTGGAPSAPEPDADAAAAARTLTLLNPAVRELMTAGGPTGDHRAAAVGFVAVSGIDELLAAQGPDAVHVALDHVATTVDRIATAHSVSWLDVDVGAGGVKLLLAAGVPHAVDDDEGRLLGALRRMLDESDVPLRAGAQRGRVYAGALGVAARRTFTVLGDAVNVAARALGLAGERDLVVGDGLGVADRPFVTVADLGPIALKNRVRPVPMWRVLAVATPGGARAPARPVDAGLGRPVERERIAEAWKRTVDGNGTSLTVLGEPGMGAAELLAEAVERAGAGATAATVDPHRRQVPYATVAAVVRALAAAAKPDPHPDRDDASGWTWLASFAPRLDANVAGWLDDAAAALGVAPAVAGVDPAATARRARAALVALLEAAAPRPWLLAVDDVDVLDDASRLVLHDLREVTARAPWLLLTSGRPGQPEANGEAASVIVLDPLDDDDAGRLVIGIGPRLRDDQVARIVAAGKGNPFVLAELARHREPGELPDSLERLGATRIDALPLAARRLVRDASTFGSAIALAVAAAVLGRPELAEPEAWADASPVLRESAPGVLAFRHDAYRIAAHRALTFSRRRELHGAIADHLAARPGTPDAVLAFHLDEAGRTREAYPLAVAAARAARAAGAPVEAVDLFARAVRMGRAVERSALGGLLVEQGEVLMRINDLANAERAFVAAGRVLSDPLDYAAMCSHRASLDVRRSRYRQARTWVRRGLTLVAPLGDDVAVEVRGRLLLDDAAALHYQGRNDESLRLASDALTAAEQAGSRWLEALAHLHLEMVHSVNQRPEAYAHGDAAVALFEALGDDDHLADALLNSGLTAMLEGRWGEALARYRRAANAAGRAGDATATAVVEVNIGFLLLRQGRTAEADAHGVRAVRVLDTGGLDLMAAYARHLRSGAAAAEGRFSDAEALMAEARATFARLGDAAMVVDCDVSRLDHLLRAGRPADALALAAAVGPDLARGDETLQVYFRLARGRALARTGDAVAGAALAAEALELAGARRPYEAYLCQAALVEIERAGGPVAPSGAAAECAAIAVALDLLD